IYGQPADIARERLGESLLRHLGERTLVVLMENLDSLFKHMPEGEQRIWRAFVQNHPVLATVGTAQSLFDGVADRSQPFFGFFDTRHLTPLNVEDAVQLLTKIARVNGDEGNEELATYLQTPTGHARVQAIHDLAGGNPRLYLIFSEFLTHESLDDLVRPFEETADRQLTSYYQERLRWLSAQQQEIIQFLCHHSQPVPVKNIAEGLFTTHNSITGQLKLLRDWHYLKSKQRGREVFYELAEPLMRLALQIKETHDHKPLTLIVDFLRVWYDRKDLEKGRDRHTLGSPGRGYFEAALAAEDSGEPNLRHQILRQWTADIDLARCSDAELMCLKPLAEESNHPQDWLKLGEALRGRKEFVGAIEAFNFALRLNATVDQKAWALISRGAVHSDIGNAQEALADFATLIGLESAPQQQIAKAYLNRGIIYANLGHTDKALAEFTASLEIKEAPPEVTSRSYFQRGFLLSNLSENQAALADFTSVIKMQDAPLDGVAWSLCKRAGLVYLTGQTENALADINYVIDMADAPKAAIAEALISRGAMHLDAGNPNALLLDYAKLFALPKEPQVIEIMAWHAKLLPQIVVTALFDHTTDPHKWRTHIAEFLPHFAEVKLLMELGESLVRHLPRLRFSPLKNAAHEAWADCWTKTCADLKPEDQTKMEIPLRLLRAGIDYLKTKDEGSLLILPIEERKLVREALGLEKERTE
ncbi:MAG: hypothetical protein ABL974_17265, partial [Prosthecobacter sp.]